MEDLADVLKRKFCGLYKKKNDVFGTVQERLEKNNEHRKMNRHEAVFEKRKIPVDMSPFVTPPSKRERSVQKKEITGNEPPTNKRLEMLAKWKVEKEKRKQMEQQNKKPLFKVTHVPVSVGLPNLDNVNKQIKGKPIKSKFAPPNHKFKPPSNVKPIYFNNTNTSIVNTPKEIQIRKEKTDVQLTKHRMTTRSQSRKPFSSCAEDKPKLVPTTKVMSQNSSEKKHPNKASMKNDKNSKSDNPNKANKNNDKDRKSDKKIENTSLMSPDYPLDAKANSSESDDVKTPNKTEPPVYVSPFVTISRGKDSARKEYEARKSRKSFSSKPDVDDCTSPKAGAAYFKWLLNSQITHLQELCEQWTKYKEQNDAPEEAVSMIDVAIGQTNLLLSKKFVQFRGLIDKCGDADTETPVTCEDLHGFWDMMHLQVDNLDKRFENLAKLRASDWLEIVPEVKKEVVKKKGRPVKNAKASAGLREAILAARRKNKVNNMEIQMQEEIKDKKEMEASVGRKTPKRRSSNRVSVVKSELSAHRNSSPGLTMMKIAQYAKSVETPAKSILKTDATKSAKSFSKTVLFEDEIALNLDDIENDLNATNSSLRSKTPQRRSLRLSKSKLF